MKESLTQFANIRNVGIKTILSIIGLVLIISVLYPFVLENLYLTDKVEDWDKSEWIQILIGFFLAVGGAKYNTLLDAILNKFQNGKVS